MATADVVKCSAEEFTWQGLTLTEAAARQIERLVEKTSGTTGLQLSIKPSGCAGWGYIMKMVERPATDNLCFISHGAKLYVPLQAMPFIDGTEVDYVHEGLNQVFKFNNPKAQHACGCGESFGVES